MLQGLEYQCLPICFCLLANLAGIPGQAWKLSRQDIDETAMSVLSRIIGKTCVGVQGVLA